MSESKEPTIYTSDCPIHTEDEDKFQRYNFAKRIADSVIQYKKQDSIVLGIYGEWGEGKSSVMNFIEINLKQENLIVCKFNPWRFSDETQLLLGFFNLITTQLQKSIKTNVEKVGEFIKEYADIVMPGMKLLENIIGVDPGETVKKAAEKISNLSIEEHKKRIEELLSHEQKRFVVFVDDIDRLNKKEVQAIFRLVKLTCDFSYTTYILAFDDKMVANAIAEQYGGFNDKCGYDFLEKIIQVPLRLPKAQKSALRNYCFDLMEQSLQFSEVVIKDEETSRFVHQFDSNILKQLSTPRMAVRYSNSILFSLPLLNGEVNIIDLLLIEGIKVFYPDIYSFIRGNPDLFVTPYSNILYTNNRTNDDRKKYCKEQIGIQIKQHDESVKEAILNLMKNLFPILNEVYGNMVYQNESFKQWYNEQRICSPSYFERYFTYCVIKGEISDVKLSEILSAIRNTDEESGTILLKAFLTINDFEGFIYKVDIKSETFDSDAAKKIITALSNNYDFIPSTPGRKTFLGMNTVNEQSSRLILKLIKKIPNEEQFSFVKEKFEKWESIDLFFEVHSQLRNDVDDSGQHKQLFGLEEFNEIAGILLNKVLHKSGDTPVFEVYPEYSRYLLTYVWVSIHGKENLHTYIKTKLDSKPEFILQLLKIYSPYFHSSIQPEPFYSDFDQKSFVTMDATFDVNYLYSIVLKLYGEDIHTDTIDYLENKQTGENRAKQFVYWYRKQKTETEVKESNV